MGYAELRSDSGNPSEPPPDAMRRCADLTESGRSPASPRLVPERKLGAAELRSDSGNRSEPAPNAVEKGHRGSGTHPSKRDPGRAAPGPCRPISYSFTTRIVSFPMMRVPSRSLRVTCQVPHLLAGLAVGWGDRLRRDAVPQDRVRPYLNVPHPSAVGHPQSAWVRSPRPRGAILRALMR